MPKTDCGVQVRAKEPRRPQNSPTPLNVQALRYTLELEQVQAEGDRTHAAPETCKAVYMYALEPAWRDTLQAPAPGVSPLAVGDGLDAASWAGHEFGGAGWATRG